MLQRWEGTRRPYLKQVWEYLCRAAAPGHLTLHTTSQEEARESQSRIPGVDTIVIPNGIEIPATVVRRDGVGKTRFVYLGRLDPKKGIENLLDAFKILRDTVESPVCLVIAGGGDEEYAQEINSRIRQLELEQSVQMLGPISDDPKREFFEAADVLVCPSHTENFGVVVAEALAHGVPVIASRGTPWQRVEEIGCGLWVDNDPASLAAAMTRILSMPLHEMGLRGREWMRREFGWDSLAREMVSVYQGLLSAS